jgi:hypothetical protein
MGHFAKVYDGRVQQVIVAEPDFFETFNDPYPGEWIQTSYNTRGGIHYKPNSAEPSEDQSKALRKNFASVGYLYDKDVDAFYEPQPYASWTLNTFSYVWEPPTPYPTDGQVYIWDEGRLRWMLAGTAQGV